MDGKQLWKRLALWLPALLWYGVIFYFSAQTGAESTEISDAFIERAFHWDIANSLMVLSSLLSTLVRKGAHAFVFFVQTGLLLFPLRELIPQKKPRRWLALALCAALALSDEVHQFFVPGRSCKLTDVLIDSLGGMCFLVLLWLLETWKANKKGAVL